MSILTSILLDNGIGTYDDIEDGGLDILDSCEDYQEIVVHNESINKLVDITMSLERLTDIVGNKGLSKNEFLLFNESSNFLLKDLGIRNPICGLENIKDEDNWISIEGLKDIASRIWGAVKKSVDNAKVKITTWFQKVFKTVERLKGNATKILERAEAAKSENKTPKEDTIEFDIGKLVSRGGDLNDLNDNLKNTRSELQSFLVNRKVVSAVDSVLKVYESVFATEGFNSDPEGSIQKMAVGADACIKAINSVSTTKGSGEVPESMKITGFNVEKHGSLLGNNALYSYYPTAGFSIIKKEEGDISHGLIAKFNKSGVVLGRNIEAAKGDKKVKIKVGLQVPSLDVIIGMIQVDIDLMDAVLEYRKTFEAVNKLKTDISGAVTSVLSKLEPKETKKEQKVVKGLGNEIISITKRFNELLDRPANDLANLAVVKTATVLDLSKRYLAVYK